MVDTSEEMIGGPEEGTEYLYRKTRPTGSPNSIQRRYPITDTFWNYLRAFHHSRNRHGDNGPMSW